jgi:hypothetical protein
MAGPIVTWVFPGNDLDGHIVFDAAAKIPQFATNPDCDGIPRQAFRDIAGNFGARYGIVELTFGSIW